MDGYERSRVSGKRGLGSHSCEPLRDVNWRAEIRRDDQLEVVSWKGSSEDLVASLRPRSITQSIFLLAIFNYFGL